MSEKILTVFTPTYNRGYCLKKCYNSLCRQTNKNFVWLVIDDGSTDNTQELIRQWQKNNNGFKIIYKYQENSGAHIAHNTAYSMIDTELCVCIDSDDFMPERAVDEIIEFWTTEKRDENVAGIIALNTYTDGTVIGDVLPRDRKRTTMFEFSHILRKNGNKKIVYRTDLIRDFPYPQFDGEKYFPEEYKYYFLDEKYTLLIMHDPICRVEPMSDSVSNFLNDEEFKSKQGFYCWYQFLLAIPMGDRKFKLEQSKNYICSAIINRDKRWLQKTPCKFLTLLAAPAGVLRYLILLYKTGRMFGKLKKT